MDDYVTTMPTEAELRVKLRADPLLLDRLRADVERASTKAAVAARFAAGNMVNRMRSAERSLPPLNHLEPGSADWTAAAIVHARHMIERLACCRALVDGAGPGMDARGLSRAGAAELLRAMAARHKREEAARENERILRKLSQPSLHREAVQ